MLFKKYRIEPFSFMSYTSSEFSSTPCSSSIFGSFASLYSVSCSFDESTFDSYSESGFGKTSESICGSDLFPTIVSISNSH